MGDANFTVRGLFSRWLSEASFLMGCRLKEIRQYNKQKDLSLEACAQSQASRMRAVELDEKQIYCPRRATARKRSKLVGSHAMDLFPVVKNAGRKPIGEAPT